MIDCPGCGARSGGPRCERCGLALTADGAASELVGEHVGPFTVEEVASLEAGELRLGATDGGTGKWVELRVRPASRARSVTRRRPRHRNLVQILDHGQAGELAYTATDARPDEVSLAAAAPLPRAQALDVAREVCRALGALHAQDLAHGQLSARHVLLDRARGTVRLLPAEDGWQEGGEGGAEDLRALGALLEQACAEPDEALSGLVHELTSSPPAADALEVRLGELLGEAPRRRPRSTGRLERRTRRVALGDYAEAEEAQLDPAALERLPLPLARAVLAAWNARPDPRRAFLAWEALGRLLAVVGVALRRAQDAPPPAALGRLRALDAAGWRAVAVEAFGDLAAEDDPLTAAAAASWRAAAARLEAVDGQRRAAVESARWPDAAAVTALLLELAALGESLPLCAAGRLLAIEEALWAEGLVTYQPWLLRGLAARHEGTFSGTAGLEPGRLYWQSGGEAPRFVELDPLAVWLDDEVRFLQRGGARPRYETFDGDRPRAVPERGAEVAELLRELGAAPDESPTAGDDSAPAPSEGGAHVGRLLGGIYRVAAKLGVGGMGVVYRGWDTRLQREVALKLLTGVRDLDPKTRERFEAEARVLARLGHPNVVRVYDVGRDGETDFYAMELLPGPTLAEWIAEQAPDAEAWERALEGPPERLRRRVRWIRDAARALHEAHEAGVVHRDLKPGNLMLDAQGEVRVLDFGLAHVLGEDRTRSRSQLGTPRYMAPEQITAPREVDGRTDVYALGLTLWALLALQRPFADVTEDHALLARVTAGDVPDVRWVNLYVPEDLATIVAKAAEARPEARYASASALADDLDCYLDGRPVSARPLSRFERLRKYVRREPVNVLVLVVLVLAVFVLAQALVSARSRGRARAGELALQYVRAVEQKDPEGMVLFAQQLEALDMHREAFVYYRRAAQAGNPEGMLRLARLLTQGDPGLRDEAEAVRWYRQAQRAGSREAAQELDALLRRRPDLR